MLMCGVRVRDRQGYQPVAGFLYPLKAFHYDSILETWQGQEICPAGAEVSKGEEPFCLLSQRKWNRLLSICGVDVSD